MLLKVLVTIFFAFWPSAQCLPSHCFDYYSEFSLDPEYNMNQNPPNGTKIKDDTILYKILEVSFKTCGFGNMSFNVIEIVITI